MTTAKIRVSDVNKIFEVPGSRRVPRHLATAVEGIDFDVNDGEFVTMVGPSGSGKTTILDLVAGLTTPTSGNVLVDGTPINGPGRDRGVVFQQYALLPWKSTLDNIVFALKAAGRGRHRAERRRLAREYLELVGLEDHANRYPHQLSGGMKQRVAIARSLSYQPEILLMDEPFGALDAQTRELLQSELLRLWKSTGTTVLFITHSVEEAVYLGQRVVVLEARPGRVKAVVDVDRPEPPAGTDPRSTPEFITHRRRVWELLHGRDQLTENPVDPDAHHGPATHEFSTVGLTGDAHRLERNPE
ncbi:MAG: ABC transporter ATP-binding protein [Kocuria sp.]|nr:ABC transporter ATP-binding protein [Kocuria sp.]